MVDDISGSFAFGSDTTQVDLVGSLMQWMQSYGVSDSVGGDLDKAQIIAVMATERVFTINFEILYLIFFETY